MRHVVTFSAALISFVVLFVFGNLWFWSQCVPIPAPGYSEPHDSVQWQCRAIYIFPVAASLVSASILAMRTARFAYVSSLVVTCAGLGALEALGYLAIWYGSDLSHATTQVATYCLFPGAVMGWFMQSVIRGYRGAL